MRLMFADGRSERVADQVKRLVDAANRSSVVVYGVDPRGLVYTGLTAADNTRGRSVRQVSEVQNQRSQQLFDSQEGMVMLAHDTRALFSPFSTGELHLRLTTLYSQAVKTGPFVNAMLHFDARELKFNDQPDDWHQAVVDVVAITYNADGQQVDATDKTWTIRVQGK